MDCKAAALWLHPYLDGELKRASVDELEAHLERCPACAKELASLESLRKVMRDNAPHYAAPASLRERLGKTNDAGSSAHVVALNARQSLTTRARWFAIAASCLFAFSLGAGSMRWYAREAASNAGEQAFVNNLLGSHLRSLAAVSPVDVISSDRHTVKPWFAGKIGQSPPVLDLAASGFPLIGGRIDYVGEQRVPVLVYGHGRHLIDVYLLPSVRAGAGRVEQVQGYRVAAVTVQQQPAWIVGDLDEQEFDRFRQLVAAGAGH